MNTTDLCDKLGLSAPFLPPRFVNYGGRRRFEGEVVTAKCFEDSSIIKTIIATPGKGKVLVVDAGGSERCAVFGDISAQVAIDNGWEGIVIDGCLRDVSALAQMELGVRAVGVVPKGSDKKGQGLTNLRIEIAGIALEPNDYLIADEDGVVVLKPQDRAALWA